MVDMNVRCKLCGYTYGSHHYESNACPTKFDPLNGDPIKFNTKTVFEYDPNYKSELYELEASLNKQKQAVTEAIEQLIQYKNHIRELEVWQSEAVEYLKTLKESASGASFAVDEYDDLERLINEVEEE